jgi:hypothetical protein
VELSAVADELYGLPLNEFTATRDERAAEARKAGETELAKSLKQLRKPSTGAWLANLLVRDQPREVGRLIKLGTTLRSDQDLEGARIRRATKEKAEAVGKLLQQARSIAKRAGLPLSQSVEQELEATLDAAFADPSSAESLREARLTTALHYSGLGFGSGATARDSTVQSQRPARVGGPETAKAKLELERAQSDAERAASEAEKAQRAVKTAQADLDRLRAALTVATRKATRADEKASAAQKKLDNLLRTRGAI